MKGGGRVFNKKQRDAGAKITSTGGNLKNVGGGRRGVSKVLRKEEVAKGEKKGGRGKLGNFLSKERIGGGSCREEVFSRP